MFTTKKVKQVLDNYDRVLKQMEETGKNRIAGRISASEMHKMNKELAEMIVVSDKEIGQLLCEDEGSDTVEDMTKYLADNFASVYKWFTSRGYDVYDAARLLSDIRSNVNMSNFEPTDTAGYEMEGYVHSAVADKDIPVQVSRAEVYGFTWEDVITWKAYVNLCTPA